MENTTETPSQPQKKLFSIPESAAVEVTVSTLTFDARRETRKAEIAEAIRKEKAKATAVRTPAVQPEQGILAQPAVRVSKPKSVPHANFTDEQRARVIRHYERVRKTVKAKGFVSHGSSLLRQRLCFSLTFTSLADYIDQAIMNAICSPTSEHWVYHHEQVNLTNSGTLRPWLVEPRRSQIIQSAGNCCFVL